MRKAYPKYLPADAADDVGAAASAFSVVVVMGAATGFEVEAAVLVGAMVLRVTV